MKVGIGYQNQKDSFQSGRMTARSAVAEGEISQPGLVLAFCGGTVDHEAFFNGIVDVVGTSVPVVGGSAIGLITNREISYNGCPTGAAVFEFSETTWRTASAGRLDLGECAAGEQIGRLLYSEDPHQSLLLFYDSLKVPASEQSPPIMNASPPLLRGITAAHGGRAPRIIGAGLLGDYAFKTSIQFCGDRIGKQAVVGVRIDGAQQVYSRITHGCVPLDGVYHTVTKSEGAILFEIDGKPVVHVIDELYGNTDWQKQIPVRRLAIGVNNGQRYTEFMEADFVNRLIAGVLPDSSGVVLFEPDLPTGTEILFMIRDAEEMIRSARTNTAELFDEIAKDGGHPIFGLYIDCGGRAAEFSWTQTEEAEEVRKLFNMRGVPLLGFYSGVEIAPLQESSRGLDWTGVLMVLAE